MKTNEHRVWRIDLADRGAGETARAAAVLNGSELARSASFRFADDRRRYLLARGALRRILGDCLGVPPATVRLTATRTGKPLLEGGSALAFNLSHSEDLALIAVGNVRAIGVDVERVRPVARRAELANRYFTASEQHEFADARNETEADDLFLQCWTRKEAVLKTLGAGLFSKPSEFAVGFADEDRALPVGSASSAEDKAGLPLERSSSVLVHSFRPDAESIAAVGIVWAPAGLEMRRSAKSAIDPRFPSECAPAEYPA